MSAGTSAETVSETFTIDSHRGSTKVESIVKLYVVEDDGVTTVESRRPKADDEAVLGAGPWRFTLYGERSISEQISSLTEKERECFEALKSKWNEAYPDKPFSDEMYLRFARCSPGVNKFNEHSSWNVMKNFNRRYLTLSAKRLESQLQSKTLFPVPGLKSKDGHDIFYMRPSRYFPKQTSTRAIIDNLVYCMTCMVEKEKACSEGIGFLAYMNDWSMTNFSVSYCFQFMKTLQGRIPVRVRLFLIVNPPGWFGRIWAIMKPMLAKDFREKVKIISEREELGNYLMDNYMEFLPDDMETGSASTDDMVNDFIKYRCFIDDVSTKVEDKSI